MTLGSPSATDQAAWNPPGLDGSAKKCVCRPSGRSVWESRAGFSWRPVLTVKTMGELGVLSLSVRPNNAGVLRERSGRHWTGTLVMNEARWHLMRPLARGEGTRREWEMRNWSCDLVFQRCRKFTTVNHITETVHSSLFGWRLTKLWNALFQDLLH